MNLVMIIGDGELATPQAREASQAFIVSHSMFASSFGAILSYGSPAWQPCGIFIPRLFIGDGVFSLYGCRGLKILHRSCVELPQVNKTPLIIDYFVIQLT